MWINGKQVSTKSHSVILTSGTLSPLDSFSSELGTKFEVHGEGDLSKAQIETKFEYETINPQYPE